MSAWCETCGGRTCVCDLLAERDQLLTKLVAKTAELAKLRLMFGEFVTGLERAFADEGSGEAGGR